MQPFGVPIQKQLATGIHPRAAVLKYNWGGAWDPAADASRLSRSTSRQEFRPLSIAFRTPPNVTESLGDFRYDYGDGSVRLSLNGFYFHAKRVVFIAVRCKPPGQNRTFDSPQPDGPRAATKVDGIGLKASAGVRDPTADASRLSRSTSRQEFRPLSIAFRTSANVTESLGDFRYGYGYGYGDRSVRLSLPGRGGLLGNFGLRFTQCVTVVAF
ncbi:hypothetical protein Rcae01_06472 [Novipirellula caenicola]|uniref:Uncharacterized protein n=1 Tax=Novipirellula caenicola TaxID=1536901 RepID=A0ABP9W0Q6_9BACT